ncbi:hypothetical protein JXJ21_05415 [candidate division KSB1 bacterium]|nr:hypothetical protein [candidate division KSB1 bacterium]
MQRGYKNSDQNNRVKSGTHREDSNIDKASEDEATFEHPSDVESSTHTQRLLRLIKRFEKILQDARSNQVAEYYEFSVNPRRIIFVNLVIGMSRGVGFVLGASVVGTMILALLTWILSSVVDIPVIGKFVAEIIESAKTYLQNNQP